MAFSLCMYVFFIPESSPFGKVSLTTAKQWFGIWNNLALHENSGSTTLCAVRFTGIGRDLCKLGEIVAQIRDPLIGARGIKQSKVDLHHVKDLHTYVLDGRYAFLVVFFRMHLHGTVYSPSL